MTEYFLTRRLGAFVVASVAACGLFFGVAQAASVTSVSPQGEVAQVRQVVVKFSEAVVAFGDPKLPDPMTVRCAGSNVPGQGRWSSDRVWLYDFKDALGPGARCTVKPRPEWQPSVPGASRLVGAAETSFSTGGPAIVQMRPWPGSEIAEDQHFLITLSGPAVESTVLAKAWCEVEGLGDRLPLRLITGAARDAQLKAERIPADRAAQTLAVACGRPLPSDTPVRLVWGAGIAAQSNPSVLTRIDQRQGYRVRKPFTAEFSCERERANAPCLPIQPMRLSFSAPIDRALANQVRLRPAVPSGVAPAAAIAPALGRDGKDDPSELVSSMSFPVPLSENTVFNIELPAGLKDDAGRTLANAAQFPLKVATGDAPPIAKFASAPFGIVELEATSMLPITLRHVQGDLRPAAASGQVRIKTLQTDADILAWYARVQKFHESQVTTREAGLPKSEWYDIERSKDSKGRVVENRSDRRIATREVSLLGSDASAQRLELPQLLGGDPRPFEVIGLPIAQPGYHVVEVASARLGQALLDKAAPMYVRTGVLVTNLGVHFKQGLESSAVWVTSLDRGRPVAGADVVVRDCRGKELWSGRTDAQGLAQIAQALDPGKQGGPCVANGRGGDAEYDGERGERGEGGGPSSDTGLFVSARKAIESGPHKGSVDTAFVFAGWQKGIEPWRFNVATRSPAWGDTQAEVRAHTVFDRTLLRASETVSMKHVIRAETAAGLAALAPADLPTRMKITHLGSGEELIQPLTWQGTRYALSSWNIPGQAKLGGYSVTLETEPPTRGADGKPLSDEEREARRRRWSSGMFRVEEFRIPLLDARVNGPKDVPVAPRELPIGVQLNYQAGGAVASAPLSLTAMLRPRGVGFAGQEGFSFEPPKPVDASEDNGSDAPAASAGGKLVADKLTATTDANGSARIALKDLPPIDRPSEVLAEVTFNDPNGEVQTIATQVPVWPSAVVVGIQAGSWVSQRGKAQFKVIALDTAGKPQAGQAIDVRGRLVKTISSRKRMVGGFYAYDNRNEVQELGTLCTGRSDAQGLVSCEAALDAAGQVELIAQAKDSAGRAVQAATSVWVTRQGELWFAQDNDDRIDVLPEKRRYEPGETARLQVRMPYREATALVAIEREGVISTRVVTLRGSDPTVDVKIEAGWGPNVYVSVLALRGRLREVPWYSFFTWGWKLPFEWLRAFRFEGKDYQAPTAMVDLAKPSFKLGMAALQVGIGERALQVRVTTDKPQYAVRQKAVARIQVLHGGKPLANGEVAFAAVDEGLLALSDNESWNLLEAMFQNRPWGVETSTAQSEIIGRRHYGRKAVAAGGGGGRGATRELFDTLLLWKGEVALDANGEATVEVPLNDSLTSFRFVAVADDGVQRFGTGTATVRVTQDLQLLAGLPPLVREGDRYTALLTVRNTTAREMKLRATLAGTVAGGGVDSASTGAIDRTPITLAPQDVVLAAGAARELTWPVEVPAGAFSIAWEAAAEEQGGPAAATDRARDRLKLTQLVSPAVPVRVLQSTLQRVEGSLSMPIAPPADALAAGGTLRGGVLGGVVVGLQPKLSGALPGLRRYFETYPFACLEQKTSKSVGLKDAALWKAVADALPTYLDADGLASYFPPRSEDGARGSDRLTAYVLAATHEAGFELPEAARTRMLDGLAAFVEGRLERRFWAPSFAASRDLDVRKIAAIEALARYGRADARQLGSVNLTPNVWPTAAVIDWLSVLKRVKGVPDQARRLDEANQILRARLTYAGTTVKFSNEDEDFWWWLMDSADANAAKLILATLDDPAWKDELPKLVVGSLGRQKRGAWLTTTANLWGSLALDKFSARFESVPVAGVTNARTGDNASSSVSVDWQKQPAGGTMNLPWPATAGVLNVDHAGAGQPWATVQGLAAIPLRKPFSAGYSVARSISAVQQKKPGQWSKGDVMRIKLVIDAQSDMTWVVVSDPVPGGATVLGSGLGRDSALATQGERREGSAWPAYEERSFEAFRGYYEFMPRGRHVVEYTVRLNNPGRFGLPPTRVEAMYAPESFGEAPIDALEVAP